jgi:ribosome-associated protein
MGLDFESKMVDYGDVGLRPHTGWPRHTADRKGEKNLSAHQYGADDTHIWVDIAAEAAADKKGERTVILDVHEVFSITDAFLITSASNDRHVRALADAITEAIRKADGPALLHSEGYNESRWVLLDYGTFIVHVFSNEAREYYDLEHLWNSVPREEYEETPEMVAATAR